VSCSLLPKKLARLPVSDSPYSLDSSQAEVVYKYAQHFPNGSQLSICIISPDSENYIGILRRNDSLVYINNSDSIFEIGSITKTFTGTILAKLVYDGKINLNDTVQKLLPVKLKQSSLSGEEIKIVNLANHTSGFPREPEDVKESQGKNYNPYDPYGGYDTKKLYNYISNKLVLQSTPGEKREYSNLGFGLLAHLLTLITGKSYEVLLEEFITKPLGMSNTFIKFNDNRKQQTVQGRNEKGEPLPYTECDSPALLGAGGIKSSAKDIVKYIRANMSDTAYFYLAQKSTKQYTEYLTQGLGWATFNAPDSFHHTSAFGATEGYTCGLIFERDVKAGIVVLTNVSAFLAAKGNYIEELCRWLYDPLPAKYAKR
jgi:CubicO group peptidase (beta-lactamase class C family)